MRIRHSCRFFLIAVSIVFVVLGSACSRGEKLKEGGSQTNNSAPMESVLSERSARDEFFRSSVNSPIPEQDRESFRGLEYYPINKALDFSVRLNRHPRPEPVRLATNTGEIRSGLRYGYFEFAVEGQSCRLQVYRLENVSENGGPNLFIPFRDATSGNETYAPGRYIDLAENTSGIYELDFNRAYNPYCIFNSDYSCPLPPAENVLSVPIRAGEKMYGKQ